MNATTSNGPSVEQLAELCEFLEAGLPLRLASNSIGVTEATVQSWMQNDTEVEIRLGAAEAGFQKRCIEAILSARDRQGNPNVRAMMWLLESRFPEQYGRKTARKSGKSTLKSAETPSSAETNREPSSDCATISQNPVDAPIIASLKSLPKPGRNTPCPCGSGHKYKHCCRATSDRTRRTGLKASLVEEPLAA